MTQNQPKDASRFLVNRKENVEPILKSLDTSARLQAVRDIFDNCYTPGSGDKFGISLAEGGCLMRPHHSVLSAMMGSLHAEDVPFQIYPSTTINNEFIAEISRFFRDDCDIPAQASDNICLGFGSSHVFDAFLASICAEGDIILTPESYYHAFAEWPVKWGGSLVNIKTSAEKGHKISADNLAQWFASNGLLSPKVKALLICNPTTTGALYTRQELEGLAGIAQQHDILVYSDEVFRGSEFFGHEVVSLASLPGMAERTVTSHSGSKTLSVADLRIGWGCGPAALINQMIYILEHSITEIPLYLQKTALAVLKTPQDYRDTARREYQLRATLIADEIDQINNRLNKLFATDKIAYIGIPFHPQSGHYIHICLDRLTGWVTPAGNVLKNSVDLTRYLAKTGQGGGVVFSSGYSKGHDGMSLYIAFAQAGFESMSKATHAYEQKMIFLDYLKQNSNEQPDQATIHAHARALGFDFIDAEEPNYQQAARDGHDILREALRRMEEALSFLSPVVLQKNANEHLSRKTA